MKKMYIGYDLGDGETIANVVFHDSDEKALKEIPKDLTMPGEKTEGKAIPTAFALENGTEKVVFASYIAQASEDVHDIHTNFKRRPSDLLSDRSAAENAFHSVDDASWDKLNSFMTPALEEYKDNVTRFTDAVFGNADFKERLKGLIAGQGDIAEIVVCVGHPTKWDKLDCAIYKAVLKESIFGQRTYLDVPISILVAAESRAAFLYVRDSGSSNGKFNNMVLLIDVGSSTIDVTAVEGNARNNAYNAGHNYLGARIIDALIMEWYLDKLKEKEEYEEYEELIKQNPNMENALLISCRLAKELIYGSDTSVARITFGDFRPIRLSRDELEGLMDVPIAPIMQKHFAYSPEIVNKVGALSWKGALKQFLSEQKAELERCKFNVESIILTGSASKMPVVKEVAVSVLTMPVFFDNEPSKTISKGLSLVGYSNDKSLEFQAEAQKILDTDILEVIRNDLPELAEGLSTRITDMVCDDMVIPKLLSWKKGGYTTVQSVLDEIKDECAGDTFAKKIEEDNECKTIMQEWMANKLGQDIAIKLHDLCERYHINDITVDQLNILNIHANASLFSGSLDKSVTEGVMSMTDIIFNIVAVITGILTYAIAPTLIVTILSIITAISTTIGFLLIDIILAIPGIGLGILLVIAGIAAGKAAKGQLENMKDALADKVVKADLPAVARKAVTEKKLMASVYDQKSKIRTQMAESIIQEENTAEITGKISETINEQVEKILDDIKYIIESK